jgi:predicted naringenin-chalcone synthase
MSYILNISTAVPEFQIGKEDLTRFYLQAFNPDETNHFVKKLNLLNSKTKINSRYSCIPDYKGNEYELYTNGNFKQSVEKRMELYKEKIMPLASKAIDKLMIQTNIQLCDFTHLITVSCTGLMAPGLEFLIAEKYGLEHTEKSSVNFLGCYAALKALKQAHYIAQSNPNACILIVSAELCSLHFYPSDVNEDIIANLLFADGAAAVIVCGNKNEHVKNKVVLQIDDIGSASVPKTAGLMKWDITSTAFRMHLSAKVVGAIKENIHNVVANFLGNEISEIDFWAIHPGGVKIVEAVQESLKLNDSNVADSMSIMQQYGNMSSPTILFILNSIFNKIKHAEQTENKKIFSCAFGPGLNIEMVSLSSVDTSHIKNLNPIIQNHAVEV